MSAVIVNSVLLSGKEDDVKRLNIQEEEGRVYFGGDEFDGCIENHNSQSMTLEVTSRKGPPLDMLISLSSEFSLLFDIQWTSGGAGCEQWGRALIRDGRIERSVYW